MATNTVSLAKVLVDMWLDHGFTARNYEKHGETLTIFFRCTHFSIVETLAIALLNITTRLSTSFCPLTLALLVLTDCPPYIHTVAHYTSLVIRSPVCLFTASSPACSLKIDAFSQ
jgi:hypothetical protein